MRGFSQSPEIYENVDLVELCIPIDVPLAVRLVVDEDTKVTSVWRSGRLANKVIAKSSKGALKLSYVQPIGKFKLEKCGLIKTQKGLSTASVIVSGRSKTARPTKASSGKELWLRKVANPQGTIVISVPPGCSYIV